MSDKSPDSSSKPPLVQVKFRNRMIVPLTLVVVLLVVASVAAVYEYQAATSANAALDKAASDLGLSKATSTQDKINVLVNEIQAERNSVASLQQQVDSFNSQVASLNSTVGSLNAEISSLNSQISLLNSQNNSLNSQISTLNAEISSLNSQISTLDSENDSLNSQISTLNAEIGSLNAEISSLNAEIASLTKVTIGIVYDTGGKGDKSFNDMAYQGVLNAQNSLGIQFIEESSTDASDYVPNIETLVSKNVSLIVCVGFLMDDAVATEAAKYPNMKFAQIDGDIYNMTNVVAIKFQENIGSALVGALAVAMTKSDVIGFIGGMSTGIIYKYWHGFQYGVSWAENYLGKSVTLLPAQYTGTTPSAWDEPTIDSQIAISMMAKGADIIYAAAGASGLGMFQAVGAADKASGWGWSLTTTPPYFAIGVDSDQDYYGTYQYFVQGLSSGFTAPSFVLTSEMKRVDTGVYTVIESVVAGNYSNFWNNPMTWGPTFYNGQTQVCGSTGDQPCNVRGVYVLGLAQDGDGPSPMTYTLQYLTPETTTVLAQLKAAILNGTANVPENYNP